MEEKLDRFRPPLDIISSVKRQIVNAGVDPDTIPMDWLEVTIAAMSKWMAQTPEGMKHVVNSLGFQWKAGVDDHRYEYDTPEGKVVEVPANKVYFFMGASVAGHPINPADLTITKKDSITCEGCGISTHCIKDVRNPSTDKIERLCNTCRFMSDNVHISRQGDPLVCRDCSKTNCAHHPTCTRRLG